MNSNEYFHEIEYDVVVRSLSYASHCSNSTGDTSPTYDTQFIQNESTIHSRYLNLEERTAVGVIQYLVKNNDTPRLMEGVKTECKGVFDIKMEPKGKQVNE